MVPYDVFGIHGGDDSMRLNWQDKIIETCEQLGVDPELFGEDTDLREWVAKHYGFESYDSFFALATCKDIVGGMALPMLPDHHNYEYHLMMDTIELIEHNFDLYADITRTEQEIEYFMQFVNENFTTEVQIATLKTITAITLRKIFDMVKASSTYNEMFDRLGDLIHI
ncbi:MAG: hypothetical protein H8E61_00780 [Bacteroidetes bacterium]|nr:hypothetical protein [Bacteroidota bacterium]